MTLHKKANVLLSADQFEKLRNKSNYKLFSIRFFSLFIHSWLKSGYDAHVYSPKFKSNFRQWKVSIHWENVKDKAINDKANNKSLKSYKPSQPTIYIIYLYSDNLYQHSMMQLLPI